MELNAEQIKKVLECCENECCDACIDCPSPSNTSGSCVVFAMRQALSLIKELTEENEKLNLRLQTSIVAKQNEIYIIQIKELTEETATWKEIAEGYQKQFEDCAEDRAKLTEENERLRDELAERPPKLVITKL